MPAGYKVERLPKRHTTLKQRRGDVIYDVVLTSQACWIYRLDDNSRDRQEKVCQQLRTRAINSDPVCLLRPSYILFVLTTLQLMWNVWVIIRYSGEWVYKI